MVSVRGPDQAASAELVMFESQACGWCVRWRQEVGSLYAGTAEGRRLPLRTVEGLHPPAGASFTLERPVTYTPTFVVVDHDRERGRITGYAGDSLFWEALARLIRDLDARTGSE
ncbi:MAG: thioredoxin family protein [Alphaproteobacteria bacterium]